MADKPMWVVSVDAGVSAQPVFDFLTNQAEELCNLTDGKVVAKLSLREDNALDVIRALSRIGKDIDIITHSDGAQLASPMYNKVRYDFFITDKYCQYELTLFQMRYNSVFPVDIMIDYTIAQEAELAEKVQINTVEEAKRTFSKIVKTNKVVYIISRLMKLADETAQASKEESLEEIQKCKEDTSNDQ